MIEQPYIILFNTEEEFNEFLPFIKENATNKNSWLRGSNKFYDNIGILVVDNDFSHASEKYFDSESEMYGNTKRYTYQEWKRLQNKDLIIENFEFC